MKIILIGLAGGHNFNYDYRIDEQLQSHSGYKVARGRSYSLPPAIDDNSGAVVKAMEELYIGFW